MSHLRISNLYTGTILFDSRIDHTDQPICVGKFVITREPYTDAEWSTILLKEEVRFKDLSGELDEFDSLNDETDDEEESA